MNKKAKNSMESNTGAPINGSPGAIQGTIKKNDKVIEIIITLPTQVYFLSGIRDFTLNLIKNMTDFSEQWAYRFQSIVDELCNNAIEHGSVEGDVITIIFRCSTSEFIEILVKDKGTGKHPMKADEISKLVAERKVQNILNGLIRGRGLPKIVSEWTDELQFTDNDLGGITVRVKKYLNDPKFQNPVGTGLENPTHIMLN